MLTTGLSGVVRTDGLCGTKPASSRTFQRGTAFMVKQGDRYLANTDEGYLVSAQFTPEGYVELGRTRLIEPTTSSGLGPRKEFDRLVNWSHPAYANGHIVQRNDREIIRASLNAEDYQ